jgi:vacuolar protein sorting-associated protein 13D
LQHLIVTVKNLSVTIEERLLLKLFLFAGYSHLTPEQEDAEESDFEVQRILTEVTSVHAKKYYFGLLKLEPGHVCISSLKIICTKFAANTYLNILLLLFSRR